MGQMLPLAYIYSRAPVNSSLSAQSPGSGARNPGACKNCFILAIVTGRPSNTGLLPLAAPLVAYRLFATMCIEQWSRNT